MAKTKPDIYDQVTDAIPAHLEAGVVPWRQPWDGGVPARLPVRVTGECYRGINVVLLWQAAVARGYVSPNWMTYAQAIRLGGQVRRGETSVRVVKYGTVRRAAPEGEDGAEDGSTFGYLRSYAVFNVAQIDGLDAAWSAAPPPLRDYGTEADAGFPEWFGRTGLKLRTRDAVRACYDIAADCIEMPPVWRFESREAHAGTLLHETCHATGAKSRLDRPFGTGFGDVDYAREEMVAELGSAMAGAQLGLAPQFEANAAYLSLLIAIDRSRDTLLDNTRQFARGYPANNALLWGARGMGKSSLVKAAHAQVVSEELALKIVEVQREDLPTIGRLLNLLRGSMDRFLLFCDDLSFSHDDQHYKSLKAVLDGGIEGRPDNVIFYATSNRRHLMPRDMIENERGTAISPARRPKKRFPFRTVSDSGWVFIRAPKTNIST